MRFLGGSSLSIVLLYLKTGELKASDLLPICATYNGTTYAVMAMDPPL